METFLISDRQMTPKDWAVDAAVAAVTFLFGCIQLMLEASNVIVPDLAMRQYLGLVNVVPTAAAYASLAVTILPVVLRRKFPWPVFIFTGVAFLALQSSFESLALPIFGPLVALFTLACERSRAELIAATCVFALGVLVGVSTERTATLTFLSRFTNVACVAAAALGGYAWRTNRAYVEEAELRAAEAERTREEEAARRVEEERVRIAREVHDITAHSLSAVSVQAAAAERLIDRDPAAAKEAIAAVRATSKSALDDIRSMIGVLRHGDSAAESAPTSDTSRLPDVAAYLERAGVAVELDVAGYERAKVPTHVDVALYGIAREAATNIVRHAGATTAVIRLSSANGCASLTVADDGRGRAPQPAAAGAPAAGAAATGASAASPAAGEGGGNGIVGMSERVRLLGGSFSAANAPGGGFRVEARIPLMETEA